MSGGTYAKCYRCEARTVTKSVRGDARRVVLDTRLLRGTPADYARLLDHLWTLAPDLSPTAQPGATINNEAIPLRDYHPDGALVYIEHDRSCTAQPAQGGLL